MQTLALIIHIISATMLGAYIILGITAAIFKRGNVSVSKYSYIFSSLTTVLSGLYLTLATGAPFGVFCIQASMIFIVGYFTHAFIRHQLSAAQID